MSRTRGRVTLPVQSIFSEDAKTFTERWGADVLRLDGNKTPDEHSKSLDVKICTTYTPVKGDNDFAMEHMDECQQVLLMSRHFLAKNTTLTIDFLDGFYREQFVADYIHDPKRWWEVIDRTAGKTVPSHKWEYDRIHDNLTITDAIPFHEYTVSFFVFIIWDPTQMYELLSDDLTNEPHHIPIDVRQPLSAAYSKERLKKWLSEHSHTDIVRFTSFFYHYILIFNEEANEQYTNWFGYGTTVSTQALETFEQEYGYAPKPEDLVDNGYFNSTFRVPTKAYRDYTHFIQRFVSRRAKELVDMVHAAGKQASMFFGESWIGTEPYGPYFQDISVDCISGNVYNGTTLRMLSDIPGIHDTEGRLLPYLSEETFEDENHACITASANWIAARRAMMRSPLDRLTFDGDLGTATSSTTFVNYIEKITDEYRTIYDNVKGRKPYSGLKVAVLNSWGTLRSWQAYTVLPGRSYKKTNPYFGILEALSGSPVDVCFLSFADIRRDGVPDDVDVIINAGDAGTAFSGGREWLDADLVTIIRKWVYDGGGFIGIGEPSAVLHGGRFFQLADVLGVDRELGFTLSTAKYHIVPRLAHFITDEHWGAYQLGEGTPDVYALTGSTEIIDYSNDEVHIAANAYGDGRGVYFSALANDPDNTRLLLRALYYASHKEDNYYIWNADNINCEVHAYPESGKYAILNNSDSPQTTDVYDGNGSRETINLEPREIMWRIM